MIQWVKQTAPYLISGVFVYLLSLDTFVQVSARSILMEYWNVGDRAFAYWEADEYYYPATITEIEDEDIYIRYDTGEEAWTNSDYLQEMIVETGDLVESKWSEDGEYYAAEVLSVSGDQVQVQYEDGNEEWTTLNNLRAWYEEEA